ncbi:hypothetical protein Dimus_033024 [Dionaea muscipula]
MRTTLMSGSKKKLRMLLALSMAVVVWCFLSHGVRSVGTQVHHVVGDDRGWDSSSDIASWAAGRIFRVGDLLWFTYSGAKDSIVELATKEELDRCNLQNPIRMYTGGLEKLSLDAEGGRFFASGNPESCKKGLKLPINVMPKSMGDDQTKSKMVLPGSEKAAAALTPTSPSSTSSRTGALPRMVLLGGILLLSWIMAM